METNKTFVRHEACPTCGSTNNRAVYYNEELKGETWFCHTPGCEDKRTDRDLAASKSAIKIDGYPLPASHLSKLGLSAKTAARYDILARGKLVFFGYRTPSGVLERAKVRDYEVPKGETKHFYWLGNAKSTTLYGMTAAQTKKALVIVTGEWDAPCASEMLGQWFSVVSVPNGDQGALKHIKANLKWIHSFDKVYLCFDNDESGQKVVADVAKIIGNNVWMVTLPKYQTQFGTTKDAKDYLQAGLTQEFKNAFFGATEHTPSFIISDDELFDGVVDFHTSTERRKGFSTGLPSLDEKIGGYRPGELSVLMGNPGRGKSSLGRGTLVHLIRQGIPVVYITLEEMADVVATRMMEIVNGVNLIKTEERKSREELAALFAPMRGLLIMGKVRGAVDTANIHEIVYYAAVTKGAKFVLFDHITAATEGEKKQSEAISMMMSMLNQLAQDLKIHVQVITHTHRKESDTEALEEDQDATPTIRDGFGSSGIEQYAHLFLALQKVPSGTWLHILKSRLWGLDGENKVKLYFRGGKYVDITGLDNGKDKGNESGSRKQPEVRQQVRTGSSNPLPTTDTESPTIPSSEEATGQSEERSPTREPAAGLDEPTSSDDHQLRLALAERVNAGDEGTADVGLSTKDRTLHRTAPKSIHEVTSSLAKRRAAHPSTVAPNLSKVGRPTGDTQRDVARSPSPAMAQLAKMFSKQKPTEDEDE